MKKWIDPSTGYIYNKARWYDISTGTFLSEYPLVQLTKNAFGYTDGNPLTQIAPLAPIATVASSVSFITGTVATESAGLGIDLYGRAATIKRKG